MDNKIKVSIICNTFNHIDYIEDAIKGFVSQITSFNYEVLIHDDASTDGTQEIIKKYEKIFPDIIKPIYQTQNQYSKGVLITKEIQLPRAQGKYIALCEGDDFWTSQYKLQKQFEILEIHQELDACTHMSSVIDARNNKVIEITQPLTEDGIIPVETFINAHGNRIVETASLFVRKRVYEENPPFLQTLYMDTTLRILGALRGGMYYINENMSSYRWLAKGSWTSHQSKDSWLVLRKKMIRMLLQLDIDTKGKYHNSISNEIIEHEFEIQIGYNNYEVLKNEKYQDIYKAMCKSRKIKLQLKKHFPFIENLKNLRIKH